jgi:hypothetical protein
MDQLESLISDEDVAEFAGRSARAEQLRGDPGVRTHLGQAAARRHRCSGGVLANNFRVPGLVVEELLAELAELDD